MNDEIPERQLPFQQKQPRKLNYAERVKAGIQRGGLPHASKKKEEWLKKYRKAKELSQEYHECKVCGKTNHKDEADCHHPSGRSGQNILDFWFICVSCHAWIHAHPNESRAKGYLFF